MTNSMPPDGHRRAEFSRGMSVRGASVRLILELDHYRYFHSTRADLLRRAGRHGDARHAYQRALDLAQTDPERSFLRDRLTELKARG